MASGHQTTTITLTTVTAANRHRVALGDIGTEGAVLLEYRMTCTDGSFTGTLYVTDGDPGAWGGTGLTAAATLDTIALQSEALSLTSGDTSREAISGSPTVVQSSTSAYLVLEDTGGTGLSSFSGKIVITFSVQ